MTMTNERAIEAMIAEDDQTGLVRPEVSALEAISRSEVAAQLDAAHRYPRSPTRFLREALSLATFSVDVAEACMYSLPRDGKMLNGPSVRLAEICASAWGNLHVGARVIDTTDREVVAQAVCWDLQTNVRVTIEAQRSILTKTGKRFSDDMIRVTGMAAISIALRNAIFRVIPRSYVQAVYEKARKVAVGDAETLVARRDDVLGRLVKMGVQQERVFARLGVAGATDITLEHLETLIGLGTAIKAGDLPLDEAFPALVVAAVPAGTPEGKRVQIQLGKGKAPKGKTEEPPKAAEPQPAANDSGPPPSPEDDGRIT